MRALLDSYDEERTVDAQLIVAGEMKSNGCDLKRKPFTCRGCGVKKTPDGNPKNAAFIWTDEKTKTRRPYCYDCDDRLIQDVPLPKEKGV